MPFFYKRFVLSYFKRRQKENRKLLHQASRMLDDPNMIDRHPHLKEGVDPLAHLDENTDNTDRDYRALIKEELEAMQQERESQQEAALLAEQEEEVSTELQTKKQRRRWYSFYKRKKHQKRVKEKSKENLKASEREKAQEKARSLEAELDPDELENAIKEEVKPKTRSRPPHLKELIISTAIKKRMEQITRVAMHAKRAPGDQAGAYDQKEVQAEKMRSGKRGEEGWKLKQDFSLGGFAKDVGMIGGIARELKEQFAPKVEQEQNRLGQLTPDRTIDLSKNDPGKGAGMGR